MATCSAPFSQPPPRSVEPRASMSPDPRDGAVLGLARGRAWTRRRRRCGRHTRRPRSDPPGSSRSMATSMACRASSIFWPAMDPDRSRTKATLTGSRWRFLRRGRCVELDEHEALAAMGERMRARSVRARKAELLRRSGWRAPFGVGCSWLFWSWSWLFLSEDLARDRDQPLDPSLSSRLSGRRTWSSMSFVSAIRSHWDRSAVGVS